MTHDDAEPAEDCSSAADKLSQEIRRLRTEASLSQSRLAAMIGYSPQYVSLAERPGKGVPSAAVVEAIDRALAAGGTLIALGDLARAEHHARRHSGPAHGPAPKAQTSQVMVPVQADGQLLLIPAELTYEDPEFVGLIRGNSDDVDRKTFLQSVLGASAGMWVGYGRGSSPDVVEAIAGPTTHYRRMEAAVSTTTLMPAVVAHAQLAASIVGMTVFTPVGRRALSETTGLAAWLAADRGDAATARRYYVDAVRHAERSDYPLLVAYMRASFGHFVIESGDPRHGLMLLSQARRDLSMGEAPHAARAWLASLHAIAYASTGERSAALDEIRTAEASSDIEAEEPQWPWMFAFDAAKAARFRAATLLELGDVAAALAAYADATPALTAPKPRALVQIEHARALADSDAVDEACALAVAALEVGRRFGSERISRRVREFRAHLPVTATTSELDARIAALYTEGV